MKPNELSRERCRSHAERNEGRFQSTQYVFRVCALLSLPIVRASMRTCGWVLSLWMTIFLSNGTADLARQPDGMRVRSCVRKLFTSTWTRPSTCHSTCLAFYNGCCHVKALMSLCPGEELTHVHRNALCIGQRYNVFRKITQNSSIQHGTIRSVLERFITFCHRSSIFRHFRP